MMAFENFIAYGLESVREDNVRARVLAVLMPFLPLTGCSEDGTTAMEVAIVAPENLSDEVEKICLNVRGDETDEGEEVCDPEWREIELSGECTYDEDVNIVDCEPGQTMGAWVYTFPFTANKWNCYNFENLPPGYLPAKQIDGVLSTIEEYCFLPILQYKGRGPKPDVLLQVDHVGELYHLVPDRDFLTYDAN